MGPRETGESRARMSGHGNDEEEGPLAHARRRYLLYCLHLYSNPMRLADVAEQVLVWERDDEPEDYLRERLYTYNDLYHEHLPVLREAGLVEYDQREDVVRLGPAAAEFEPALERHLSAELGGLLHAEHSTFEGPSPGPFPAGLYRALAVPDRRRTLYYLLERSGVPVGELADVLAGWRSVEGWSVGPGTRARTLEDLREVHLPMLAEVGLVEYDTDAETVALSSLTGSVREVIRSAIPSGTPRPSRSAPPPGDHDDHGQRVHRE